jgi:streptogramin lyase
MWATLRWAGRIARIDTRTGEYETIRVGRSPHGIFIQPRRAESEGPAQTAAIGRTAGHGR